MRRRGVRRLLVALVVGTAGPASADSLFRNEKDFLGAVGSAALESFEELTANDATRQETVLTTGFTVTTRGRHMGIFSSVVVGLHATHDSKHLVWDAAPGTITFTFKASISAFGVTLNDALDQGTDPRLSLTTDGGASHSDFLVGPLDDANESFVGIITDTPFTRLTIRSSTRDSMGFDGVHFSPIAEPTPGLP